MSDWSSGYVTEIGYTYGYYADLNPLRIKFVFLFAGLAPPEIGTACELAFGQGVSVNLHAAAGTAKWWGNDFSPAQAHYANELAQASGAGAELTDESFAEFCNRSDLPDFDYISLHGIFSWVTADNQQTIVDFIRRKLKPGGVLYISYNTYPGWSTMMPVRHLLAQHANAMGGEGQGVLRRLNDSLGFMDQLLAANPLIARANPQLGERYKKLKEQNRSYLAHEYFNRNWEPLFFSQMAERLQAAKLEYATTSVFAQHMDALNLTTEQQALLRGIDNVVFRESVRDFVINQQFRKDFWAKGLRRLTPLEQVEQLRKQHVVLVMPRKDVPMKITGSLGESTLNDKVYAPVLDALADNQPKSLEQLANDVKNAGVTQQQLLQAVLVLLGGSALYPAQDPATVNQVRARTRKLNSYLVTRAISRDEMGYLASPVMGGGFGVGRLQQLFLLAQSKGRKTVPELAGAVWEILNSQGQKILKEGKQLPTEAENLAELSRLATTFLERDLAIYKGLGIV